MAYKVNPLSFGQFNQQQDQTPSGFGYDYGDVQQYEAPQVPQQEMDEQGIIADFIDKVQGGAWSAAADIVTGSRGLLTDDRVWEMEQYLRDQVTAQNETLSQAQLEADKMGAFESPRSFMGAVASGIGSIVPSMVAGGLAGIGGRALAGKAAQMMGAGDKVSDVAETAGQFAGAGTAGAPMIGGAAMNQISDELNIMTNEQFTQLPNFDQYYQNAIQQNPDDPNTAMQMTRDAYIQDAEKTAVRYGAAVGGLSMGVAGPYLEKILKGGQGILPGAWLGARTEAVQEGFESGAQEAIVNPLAGRDVTEGVGSAMLEGAVLGGIIGGGVGGVGGLRSPQEVQAEQAPPGYMGAEQQPYGPQPFYGPVDDNEADIARQMETDLLNDPFIEEPIQDQAIQEEIEQPVQEVQYPKPEKAITKMNPEELQQYSAEINNYARDILNYGDINNELQAVEEIQRRVGILQEKPVLDEVAQEAATSPDNELPEPTEAQKEAGNYKKAHPTVQGMKIAVENPKGSERKGKDKAGKDWSVTMNDHYGYFKGTEGFDKDHLDVFMGPTAEQAEQVYVVDQVTPSTGKFDEHKVMMGYDNIQQAEDAYRSNYDNDWKGLSNITEMPLDEFKQWAYSNEPKKGALVKPSAEAPLIKAPVVDLKERRDRKKAKQSYAEYRKGVKDAAQRKESEAIAKRDRDQQLAEDKARKEKEITKASEEKPKEVVEPKTIKKGENARKGNLVNLGSSSIQEIVDVKLDADTDNYVKIKTVKTKDKDGNWQDYKGRARKVSVGEFIRLTGFYPALPGPIKATKDDAMAPEAPEVKPAPEKKPKLDFEQDKAKSDLDSAMGDLASIMEGYSTKGIMPVETEQKLLPVLTRLMDAAFRLGYYKFKDNAKFVIDTIRDKMGDTVADAIDIDYLQGSYVAMSKRYKDTGETTPKQEVITTEELDDGLLHTDTGRDVETGRAKPAATKKTGPGVRVADKGRKGAISDEGAKGPKVTSKPAAKRADSKTSDRSGAIEYQGRDRIDERNNYTITSQEDLASGSAYQIAKSNLDAIKIAKRIASADNDTATDIEQAILAKYAGWGAGEIKNKVFPPNNKPEGRWKEIFDQLNELLTPEELKTLRKSTQYAHYTSKEVIDAMYKAVDGFGFKAGSVFEGGVGSGNFMGLMPKKFTVPSYIGVEMDSITADIAQALYPDNRVIKADFTKVNLPDNHFNLVIGNPPFADVRYKLGSNKLMMHDYFIAKQIDSLRPGSVGAFVTSTGTMDKLEDAARQYIDKKAVLLGAIRLPKTAFKDSAKTSVTTDLLFFQKRDSANPDIKGVNWMESVDGNSIGVDTSVNEYFVKNPGMMLGTPSLGGQFKGRFDLLPSGDLDKQLNKAVASLPKDVIPSNPTVEEIQAQDAQYEIVPEAKDSNFYIDKNNVPRMVIGGVGTIVQDRKTYGRGKTVKQMEQLRDYIPLRDALMETMKNQSKDVAWKKSVKKLNNQYDSFVKKHGPLNQVKVTERKDGKTIYQYPIITNLEDDAELFRVISAEQYNEITGEATKGDIFTDQLFGKQKPVEINTAEDALAVTLNEKGYLDMDYLESIYKIPEKEIIDELGDMVYQDPVSEHWITSDDYLSGNVKAKLAFAKGAKGYQRNIDALEKIIPEDKSLSEIPINLGAFWIDTDIVKKFAQEKLDFTGNVNNVIRGDTSSWSVVGRAENTAEFGTAEKTPVELLDAALNRKTIRITYKDNDGKTIVMVAESTAANEKVKVIRDAFMDWALNDEQTSQKLHEVYNRDFNTTVPRKYDGSMLTLPGLSSKYALHKWQKDVVWRIIQNGNTYMAHTVGAGKTLASIVSGMELKRLGLADKPSYVVLKSTLKQFAAEFYDAYPNAKLLIADENQLSPRNRRHFMGKVANENWDAVIITHQSFEKIPMGDEFVSKYIENQIEEYKATLEDIPEDDLPNRRTIENTIEKMEAQLEEITQGADKDKGVTFEDSGIDQLFVDEAHTHKKVQFPTAQSSMKGIDPQGSKIAMDMFLKTRYLNTFKPNKNLVLMSGTPVTNTIGELFNIQRFLQPDVLKVTGTSSFDAWSSTFTESTTSYEMRPNGEHHPVTRLNKFVGLPGLLRDFLQVADIVGDRALEESTTIKNRPSLKNNAREIVVVPIGNSMKNYMTELDGRIKAVEARKGPPKKGEDNILVIMTDGRNASIDMRLVGRENDVPSKLDIMIDNAYQTWVDGSNKEYTTRGKVDPIKGDVQLIFTTVNKTKHSSFSVYNHVRDTLIKKGVPASEIAFIQDYSDSKKKKRLFNDVDAGKVRFILGGTQNLGTGTNVQKRLDKIHHLSIDYRPSDLTQREGRMIRQGNQNKEVESIAYAAEGTIDAFMWGMLEAKAGMINQAMSGDLSVNSVADVANEQSQLAMAKAISSGNPALLEIAELSNDVSRLNSLESAYVNQRFAARKTLRNSDLAKESIDFWKEEVKPIAGIYKDTSGDKFNAELYGKKYTDRKDFLTALNASPKVQKGEPVGKIGNLPIYGSVNNEISFNAEKDDIYIPGEMVVLNLAPVKLTGDLGFGAVKRMENTARNYATVSEDLNEIADKVKKREQNANKILSSEFDKTEELQTKRARLIELEESLKAPEPTTEPETPIEGEEDYSLLDDIINDFTIDDKKASYTIKRMFNVIKDYAYPKGNVKSAVVYVNPKEFIKATSTDPDEIYRASRKYYTQEKLEAETQTPFIRIEKEGRGFKITQHEGRHRMAYLADQGVTQVPLVVNNYDAAYDDITVGLKDNQKIQSQWEGTKDLTINSPVDVSFDNADKLQDTFTDPNADVEFSKLGKKAPVEHPDFSYTGNLKNAPDTSVRKIFNTINDKYGRPMFGASKFKNLDIISDPVQKWRGKFDPKTKQITLNAYYITPDEAANLLHHEKVHEYVKEDAGFRKVSMDIIKRAMKNPNSAAGKALEIARRRVPKDAKDYNRKIFEETMAYLVQYYNKPEVKGIFNKVATVIAKFFRGKFGIKMNEDDAVKYLEDMVKAEAEGFATEQKMADMLQGAEVEEIEYSALGDIKDILADKFENEFTDTLKSNIKSQAWGVLNVRQIAEVLGKYAPEIKNKYIDRFKRFEADMNKMKQNAGDIAMERQDLSKSENEQLAKVQHEATIEGYDPSIKAPEGFEQEGIKNDYEKLNREAKEVYSSERDYHKKMHDARLKALVERIDAIEADEGFKESMIEKLHKEFDRAMKDGPYFPLARFGQYWVSSENAQGVKSFDMFENEYSQKRFVEELKADPNEEVVGFGKNLDKLKTVDGVSGQFISDVDKLIRKGGDSPVTQQIRDDVFQLYLETLPELSARKKYLHRGKVKGYAKDQARAFAQKARADANDVARLRHIHVLQRMIDDTETSLNIASSTKLKRQFSDHVTALQDAIENVPFGITDFEIQELNEKAPFKVFALNETADPEKEIKRVLAKEKTLLQNAEKITEDKITFVANGLNELKKSHEAMVNNQTHPIASNLNSLGFLWYLGASPAAALVNLTQTPTVALPMMLADKSLKNSARYLAGAVKDFIAGKGTIEPTLNANERKAFNEWHDSGLLENTQAHDLSGVADSGIDTGTFKNKAMRMISFMFHRAEVMNREVTALATYRAAMAGGATHEQAVKKGADLTWNSHLDYGASNRARFMRGNTMRVITQFKQYSQGITYIYAKTLLDTFKGETKQDRQQAMKLLGMLVSSQIAVAGTLGLPMAGVVMGMAQGLKDAFDDDDEATSVKAEFRQAMANFAGKRGGQAISHGLIDAFTPLSMSGRLSMADLWIRTPDFDQEGKAEALSYIEALGGPMVSIFTNMFMGKDSLKDGNFMRAAEQMTPKVVKDFMRATRYATEGNLTRAGLKIKDMTPAEMIAQTLGFSSSEVSEIRERATQIKNIEKKRTTRRKEIIDNWMKSDDRDMTEIQAWNDKYPMDRITSKTLRAARKSKLRYASQVVKGVRRTKRNIDLIEEYDF